jgi:UPF0042 nucleotide-binding protein
MLTIVSFGYGHATPPAAHFTLDVRELFRDPHMDPALRELTGRDAAVVQSVMRLPGASETVADLAGLIDTLAGIQPDVTVAIGCVGGRHRSVALAAALGDLVRAMGMDVVVKHLDIDKPVLPRQPKPSYGSSDRGYVAR